VFVCTPAALLNAFGLVIHILECLLSNLGAQLNMVCSPDFLFLLHSSDDFHLYAQTITDEATGPSKLVVGDFKNYVKSQQYEELHYTITLWCFGTAVGGILLTLLASSFPSASKQLCPLIRRMMMPIMDRDEPLNGLNDFISITRFSNTNIWLLVPDLLVLITWMASHSKSMLCRTHSLSPMHIMSSFRFS
jgi:hypothetical protein